MKRAKLENETLEQSKMKTVGKEKSETTEVNEKRMDFGGNKRGVIDDLIISLKDGKELTQRALKRREKGGDGSKRNSRM